MFKMTTPCDQCPFRRVGGVRLHPERVGEIAGTFTVEGRGGAFPCHKTVEHGDEDDNGDTPIANIGDVEICAGGMLFAMKHNVTPQMLQLGERLGWWKRDAMRGSDLIFDSVDEMLRVNAEEL